MSVEIREVLNRRTDLSTFVVHLTRDDTPNDYAPDAFPLPLPDARANLRSIIEGRALSAGRAMGWALGVPGLALNVANIGKMTPFIEGMGTWAGGDPEQREFWWEREWRHHGQIDLAPWWDKAVWLCPEEQSASSAPWWKPWAEFPAPVSTPIGDWSRSSATCRDSPPTT